MNQKNKDTLLHLLQQHKELGISEQIDYEKFYLYSIITHSTAIEGSTVTEVEAQLLFDEGITSSKRTIMEQNMNLDLKVAYDYGREWIMRHEDITIDWLVLLASKVMARTGSEYHPIGGDFSAAKGELRKLNVTAGAGGKSYMSYLKVPMKLQAFCEELNRKRNTIDPADIAAVYDLSFWAHFELVTIHPWADGNGRTCRLLMNLLQMEYGVLPTKVLKEDKAEYIQSLIDTREAEDIEIFINKMIEQHASHLRSEIATYIASASDKPAETSDKPAETSDKTSDILLFIARHPLCKADEVARHIGLSPQRTRHYLTLMVKDGRLIPHGANKNRTYSVAEQAF